MNSKTCVVAIIDYEGKEFKLELKAIASRTFNGQPCYMWHHKPLPDSLTIISGTDFIEQLQIAIQIFGPYKFRII